MFARLRARGTCSPIDVKLSHWEATKLPSAPHVHNCPLMIRTATFTAGLLIMFRRSRGPREVLARPFQNVCTRDTSLPEPSCIEDQERLIFSPITGWLFPFSYELKVPSRLDMNPPAASQKRVYPVFRSSKPCATRTPAMLTVRTITTGPTAYAPPNAVRGASEHQLARGRTEGRKLRRPRYSQLRFC